MRSLVLFALLPLAGCAQVAEGQRQNLNNMRIQDAVSGYETARRKADPMDMCVKAKLVAIAYEDAKDFTNAQAWKSKEREDCSALMAAYGVTEPADR
ncbi:hypothetical protein [Phenylobacterium sp.]|jgi:uncharacterized protein YgiB involved in biofilm formation|uniref:hypothetical protein n=1 Tax=Phenylobacterium sp. TaxID=1871053 RepID=UPI002F927E80